MSKKSILVLAMTLSMVAILAIGGTLAYFTDTTEVETNVFTTGDVEIELNEEFDPENAKLLPGVDVQKEVTVTSTGSEKCYVRVHIAVPKLLDSGKPEFAAYKNTLHWNFTKASFAEGLWSWDLDGTGPNYPGNGGKWNTYEVTVDGIEYTVYVATYETALATGETTGQPAMTKVYLDTKVTNEQMEAIIEELGEIKILVVAEGAQEAEYEEAGAYAAFKDQFGVLSSTNNPFVD